MDITRGDDFDDSSSEEDYMIEVMNSKKISRPSSRNGSTVSSKDRRYFKKELEEKSDRPVRDDVSVSSDDSSMSGPGQQKHFSFNREQPQPHQSLPQQPQFQPQPNNPYQSFDQESVSSYDGSEMDDEEIEKKKRYYLSQIRKLEKRGVELQTHVSLQTPLQTLKQEYYVCKKEYDVSNCLNSMKNGLVLGCTGVEKATDYMDVGVNLSGWAASVAAAIDDEDDPEGRDILEDLYEKHYDKLSGFSPEARLAYFLGKTAFTQHTINSLTTQSSFVKGMDDNLKQNPQFQEELKHLMTKHTEGDRNKMYDQLNNQVNNQMNSFMGRPQQPPQQMMERPTRDMSGPDTDELLASLGITEDSGERTLRLDM